MAIGSVLGVASLEYEYNLMKQDRNEQHRAFFAQQHLNSYGAYVQQSGNMWFGALPPGQSVPASVPSRTIDKLRAEIKAWHGDLRA